MSTFPTSARVLALWTAVSHLAVGVVPLRAAPQGGVVVAGQATIGQPSPGVTLVRQATDRAIVNWSGFSTAAGEAVRFEQPAVTSAVLNRVTGQDPSRLAGTLEANGKVFLINPNGVVFQPGSQTNVGGLVASTLAISDADFTAGRYRLEAAPGRPHGAVINRGTIRAAAGGDVALVAPLVANEGEIVAPGGRVALAAGTRAVVNPDGQGLVSLAVEVPAGAVHLDPRDSSPLLEQVVNNRHLLEAGSVQRIGDRVVLGGAAGLAVQAGRVDAGGAAAGGVRIDSLQATALLPGSLTAASGTAPGATGGRVEALSRGTTVASAAARMEARGGHRGRGGVIEVSGDRRVQALAAVDARAPEGTLGDYLIDPLVLTIVAGAAGTGTLDGATAGGVGAAEPTPFFGETISEGTLEAITTANVHLRARERLQVGATGGAAVNLEMADGVSLTLESTGGTLGYHADPSTSLRTRGGGALTFQAVRGMGLGHASARDDVGGHGDVTATTGGTLSVSGTLDGGAILLTADRIETTGAGVIAGFQAEVTGDTADGAAPLNVTANSLHVTGDRTHIHAAPESGTLELTFGKAAGYANIQVDGSILLQNAVRADELVLGASGPGASIRSSGSGLAGGRHAVLTAGGQITSLLTDLSRLTATGTSISLTEIDTLTADGLTVESLTSSAAAGISIGTTHGSILDDGVDATVLTATRVLLLPAGSVGTAARPLSLSGSTIDLRAETTAGDIAVKASGNVTMDQLNASGGVSLEAAGAISGGSNFGLTAASARLVAGGALSGAATERYIQAGQITLKSGGSIGGGGAPIRIGQFAGGPSGLPPAALSYDAAGDVTLRARSRGLEVSGRGAARLSVQVEGGNLAVGAAGVGASGDVLLDVTDSGSLTLLGAVGSGPAASVTLSAGSSAGDALWRAHGVPAIVAGNLTLQAGDDIGSGADPILTDVANLSVSTGASAFVQEVGTGARAGLTLQLSSAATAFRLISTGDISHTGNASDSYALGRAMFAADGSIGNSTRPMRLSSPDLDATSATGDIALHVDGPSTFRTVTARGSVTAFVNGTLTLGHDIDGIVSGNAIDISVLGSVLDGHFDQAPSPQDPTAGPFTNLSALTLSLLATGTLGTLENPLEYATAAANVTATGSNDAVQVDATTLGRLLTAGTVTIHAPGSLVGGPTFGSEVILADAADLRVGGGIGASGLPLNVDVGRLSVTATHILAGASIAKLTASPLTLDGIAVTNVLELAAAGPVLSAGGPGPDLSVAALHLSGGGTFGTLAAPLKTSIGTLSASGVAGLHLDNAGGTLLLGPIGVTGAGPEPTLSLVAGALRVDPGLPGTVSAASIRLGASGGIGDTGPLQLAAGRLDASATSGPIDVEQASGNLVLGTVVASGSVRVRLSDGDLLLGDVDATTGALRGLVSGSTVDLTALDGSILDGQSDGAAALTNVLAAGGTLLARDADPGDGRADGRIGAAGEALEVIGVTIDGLTANAAPQSSVVLGRLDASAALVLNAAAITDGNGGELNLVAPGAAIVTAGGVGAADALEVDLGSLAVMAGGAVGIEDSGSDGLELGLVQATGLIAISTQGDLTGTGLTVSGPAARLSAGGDLDLDIAVGFLDAFAAGTLEVEQMGGMSLRLGTVTAASTATDRDTVIVSNPGGGVVLGATGGGLVSGSRVAITAATIEDGQGETGTALTNVSAGAGLSLTAAGGVGTVADPLEIRSANVVISGPEFTTRTGPVVIGALTGHSHLTAVDDVVDGNGDAANVSGGTFGAAVTGSIGFHAGIADALEVADGVIDFAPVSGEVHLRGLGTAGLTLRALAAAKAVLTSDGAIRDTGAPADLVKAGHLVLSAHDALGSLANPLNTETALLEAVSGTGDGAGGLFLTNRGDLEISPGAAVPGLFDSYTLDADGGAADLRIETTGRFRTGNIDREQFAVIRARNLTVIAGTDPAPGSTPLLSMNTNVQRLDAHQAAPTGEILITDFSDDGIALGLLSTAAGNPDVIDLIAYGAITDANGDDPNAIGARVLLKGYGSIGSTGTAAGDDPLEIQAPRVELGAVDFDLVAGGQRYRAALSGTSELRVTVPDASSVAAVTVDGAAVTFGGSPATAGLLSAATGATDLSFDSLTDDVRLGSVVARTARVTAHSGAILDGTAGQLALVSAGTVRLTAGTTIGNATDALEIDSARWVDWEAKGGGIFASGTGAGTVELGNVTAGTAVRGNAGLSRAVLSTAGSFATAGAGFAVDAADVQLSAAGSLGNASVPLRLRTERLGATAAGADAVGRVDLAVTDAPGVAPGTLVLDRVAGDTVRLVASTKRLTDGNAGLINLEGTGVALAALAAGASGDALETRAGVLSGAVTGGGAGDGIYIDDRAATGVTLGSISSAGDLEIASQGAISGAAVDAPIALLQAGGALRLSAAGAVGAADAYLETDVTGSLDVLAGGGVWLFERSSGGVEVQRVQAGTATRSDVHLVTRGALTLASGGSGVRGAAVRLLAGAGIGADPAPLKVDALTLAATAGASGDGSIWLEDTASPATGPLGLELLDAFGDGTGTAGTVRLVTGRAVEDRNDAGTPVRNVRGAAFLLTAPSAGSVADALEVEVAQLTLAGLTGSATSVLADPTGVTDLSITTASGAPAVRFTGAGSEALALGGGPLTGQLLATRLTVVQTTGDLVAGNLSAAEVDLTAGASLTGDGTLAAGRIELEAGAGIGSASDSLRVQTDRLSATVTGAGGTAYLESTGAGSLVLERLVAPEVVQMVANGAIEAAVTAPVVQSRNVILEAAGDLGNATVPIGLDRVESLRAISSGGDVAVSVAGAVTVALDEVRALGNVSLTATDGALADGNGGLVNAYGARVALAAGLGIGTASDPLELVTGGVDAVAGSRDLAGSAGIHLRSLDTGPLIVGELDADGDHTCPAGDVSLFAAGSLADDGSDLTVVRGQRVQLDALGSIGQAGAELDLAAGRLDASAGDGDIAVVQTGAPLTLGTVTSPGNITVQAPSLTLGGAGADLVSGARVTLTATAGGIADGQGGGAADDAGLALTNVSASGEVALIATGAVGSASDRIEVNAGGGATSSGAPAGLAATSSVRMGRLAATPGVRVVIAAGDLLDGSPGAGADLIADTAVLRVAGRVGSDGTTVDPLETDVRFLSLLQSSPGAAHLANIGTAELFVDEIEAGDLFLSTAGALSGASEETVIHAGNVTLSAGGGIGATATLFLDATRLDATAGSTGILIEERDTLTQDGLTIGAVTVSTGGTLGLVVDSGNLTIAGGAPVALSADTVFLQVAGAVTGRVPIRARQLTATSGAGSLDFLETATDGLELAGVSAASGAGDVRIDAGGAITATAGTGAIVSGADVQLLSGGAIGDASRPMRAEATTVTLRSGDGQGVFFQDRDVRADGLSVSSAGSSAGNGTVELSSRGTLTGNIAAASALVSSSLGNVTLTGQVTTLQGSASGSFALDDQTGGLEVRAVTAGVAGTVDLKTGGALTDGNGAALNITAGIVRLQGAGVDGLELATRDLSIDVSGTSGASVSVTQFLERFVYQGRFGSPLSVSELGTGHALRVDPLLGGTLASADASLFFTGDPVVVGQLTAKQLSITSADSITKAGFSVGTNLSADAITLDSGGAITLAVQAGRIDARATQNLSLGTELELGLGRVTSANGGVFFTGPGTLHDANGADLNLQGLSVDLSAGLIGFRGDVEDALEIATGNLSLSMVQTNARARIQNTQALSSLRIITTGSVRDIAYRGAGTDFLTLAGDLSADLAGSLSYQQLSGNVRVGAIRSGTGVELRGDAAYVDANGDATNVTAPRLTVSVRDGFGQAGDPMDITVPGATSFEAARGPLAVRHTGGNWSPVVSRSKLVHLILETGNLTVGEIPATDEVQLVARTGNLVDGNGDATNALGSRSTLQAGGHIGMSGDRFEISSAQSPSITAGGGIYLTNFNNGWTVESLTAGRELDFFQEFGSVTAGSIRSGRDMSFGLSQGSLTANTLTSGGTVFLGVSSGAVTLGSLDATGDIFVSGADKAFSIGSLSARGNVDIGISGGALSVGSTDVQGFVILGARNAPLSVGSLHAGGNVTLRAREGAFSLGALDTRGTVSIDAGSVPATLGSIDARGAVTLGVRTGSLTLGSVASRSSVNVDVTSGRLLDGNGSTDNVIAPKVTLRASGSIGADSDLLDLSTFELLSATSTGSGVFLRQTGGLSILRAVSAKQGVRIDQQTGSLHLGRIDAGGTIRIRALDGDLKDANGDDENLVTTTGGRSYLEASGTISSSDYLEVNTPNGELEVRANGVQRGISAALKGTVKGNELLAFYTPPGRILLNFRETGRLSTDTSLASLNPTQQGAGTTAGGSTTTSAPETQESLIVIQDAEDESVETIQQTAADTDLSDPENLEEVLNIDGQIVNISFSYQDGVRVVTTTYLVVTTQIIIVGGP